MSFDALSTLHLELTIVHEAPRFKSLGRCLSLKPFFLGETWF